MHNHSIIQLRVAFTTSDYERLVKFYCEDLGIEPVVTPWRDINVRFEDPDGMQVTLFQEAENNE